MFGRNANTNLFTIVNSELFSNHNSDKLEKKRQISLKIFVLHIILKSFQTYGNHTKPVITNTDH